MNNFLSDPNNYLIVSIINNEVVGYLVAYELQRVDRKERAMYFYEIGVLKDRRNGDVKW